ncbi:hypothetical protein LCGC14_2917640, partial [marine sediment metagenome]
FNKRAEMYWRLREQFERGTISLPDDPDLQDQLGAMRCEFVKSKVKIVDKKKIMHEIGHSPDEAEALALTYFYPDTMASKVTASRRGREHVPSRSATAWMAG